MSRTKQETNLEIKAIYNQIIESGLNAHIDGPTGNVLVCDSMNDWIQVASKFSELGYDCASPGGWGGSHPKDRQNTHNKIWKSGTVCASVVQKRFWIFFLPQTSHDYQLIHSQQDKS